MSKRVGWRAQHSSAIQTGTAAKTVLQIIAAANHRLSNVYFNIGFKGVTGTDVPITVDVVKQTTDGTSSALTPVKDCDTDDETLQVTARRDASVEPTTTDLKWSYAVHPQAGARMIGPFTIPGGQRLGLRVTAAVDVACIPSAQGEE